MNRRQFLLCGAALPMAVAAPSLFSGAAAGSRAGKVLAFDAGSAPTVIDAAFIRQYWSTVHVAFQPLQDRLDWFSLTRQEEPKATPT